MCQENARPAEPEPGEDEAWEALASDLWGTEMTLTETIAIINDHRPRITAAIRGPELDVERLARAMHRTKQHGDRHSDFRGCAWCSPEAEAIAREYAALHN